MDNKIKIAIAPFAKYYYEDYVFHNKTHDVQYATIEQFHDEVVVTCKNGLFFKYVGSVFVHSLKKVAPTLTNSISSTSSVCSKCEGIVGGHGLDACYCI